MMRFNRFKQNLADVRVLYKLLSSWISLFANDVTSFSTAGDDAWKSLGPEDN